MVKKEFLINVGNIVRFCDVDKMREIEFHSLDETLLNP
jgi:hypothetical protein